MKKMLIILFVLLCFGANSFAKDVHVRGYTRKDGTYVRPHVRSSPNNSKWDNYGPSKSDSELQNPSLRDNDGDGIPNSQDTDDDNDGINDDNDSTQYGD